jgi:sugar-phosphatase
MNTSLPDATDASTSTARRLTAGDDIPISGALFDMDGTLVNSIPAVEGAWSILADEYGLTHDFARLHGRTAPSVVAALGVPPEHQDAGVRRLIEIESRPGQVLDALPGARELLESLPADRWGVVTSAPRDVARARYGASGLPRPAFFVTGDDITRGKPDPEPFLRGIDRLRERGVEGTVLAFEDSTSGARSARAAGCLTIGIAGTADRAALAREAHVVVPSLAQLRVTAGPRITLLR